MDSSNIKEYLPQIVSGGLAIAVSAAVVYKLRQKYYQDDNSNMPLRKLDSLVSTEDVQTERVEEEDHLILNLIYGEDLTEEMTKLQEKDKDQFKQVR